MDQLPRIHKPVTFPSSPADLLSSLPPGHFFGHLPGGRKVKGRVLMMRMDDKDRFKPSKHGHVAYQHKISENPVKDEDLGEEAEASEREVFGPETDVVFAAQDVSNHHYQQATTGLAA